MATVKVPDIGDFSDVPVIEILVSEGDEVSAEDPLLTLESEKATMDVPAPEAGTVEKLLVEVGDKVSEGDPLLELGGGEEEKEGGEGEDDEAGEAEDADDADDAEKARDGEDVDSPPSDEDAPSEGGKSPSDARRAGGEDAEEKPGRVVVIGSGPGGYTAAFRAADLGLDVVLVERYESLGGVCLNVGCIPSKALLHATRVIAEVEEAADFGVRFGDPDVDLDRLREWKDEVVGKLTGGLAGMAQRRKVKVVTGEAKLTSANELDVDGTRIEFSHCIIAAGSRAIELPGLSFDGERVVHSTGALELPDVPERLLVVGGGIIGMEMAGVYEGLGSQVSVVELTDTLLPGCDPDLVRPLAKRMEPRLEAMMLSTKVAAVEQTEKGLEVSFEGDDAPGPQVYDRVLVAAGRRANGDLLELGESGVEVRDDGVIPTDEQQRTNVPNIFAIGDITDGPMLAHKATYEGKVAAEVIAGQEVAFDARAVPAVAYTDPEVAWTGLTESDAGETPYEVGKFPWAASGRALGMARPDGLTKVLVDPDSRRILGAGAVGINAGELIAEATLAIELGADAEDLGLTIHPHPTLSETMTFAAEVAEGVATDIYAPKRKRPAA
jgi:dihydrolipoamide dehydrogenase